MHFSEKGDFEDIDEVEKRLKDKDPEKLILNVFFKVTRL